jgi:hypothetical protein
MPAFAGMRGEAISLRTPTKGQEKEEGGSTNPPLDPFGKIPGFKFFAAHVESTTHLPHIRFYLDSLRRSKNPQRSTPLLPCPNIRVQFRRSKILKSVSSSEDLFHCRSYAAKCHMRSPKDIMCAFRNYLANISTGGAGYGPRVQCNCPSNLLFYNVKNRHCLIHRSLSESFNLSIQINIYNPVV